MNLLLVSVALVHGKMAPLLLGHGEAEHHASKARQRNVAHITEAKIRKKEKQGESGQDTYFQSKPLASFSTDEALPLTTSQWDH